MRVLVALASALLVASVCIASLGCGRSSAGCGSLEDTAEMGQRISKALTEIAQEDPERMEALTRRMQEIGRKTIETEDPDVACRGYAALIEELGL